MYKIIGTDGQTYGPVNLEQLQQWLQQNRVDQRTPVLVEGAAAWTVLGLLPAFAAHFASPPPVITPLKPTPAPGLKTNGFATAGLVCGLLAWTCCCCFPVNLLGVVFSVIALWQISLQPDLYGGRTLAMIGLILSGVNLVWTCGFALLEFLSAPLPIWWHLGRM